VRRANTPTPEPPWRDGATSKEEPMPNLDFKLAIVEYWSVPEENMDRWTYFYENIFLGALTYADGYSGTTIHTRSDTLQQVLGGPPTRRVIAPHPFLHQLGVRTNAMIDFDALLQHEYNVVCIHFLHDASNIAKLFDQFVAGYERVQPNWREEHPNAASAEDALIEDYFSLIDNHWDVFWDVTKVFWNEGPAAPVPPPR
jgi:hypothetical protein